MQQVKEELGRGLTSIVCKCVDRFTDEKYAVKIIDLNQVLLPCYQVFL